MPKQLDIADITELKEQEEKLLPENLPPSLQELREPTDSENQMSVLEWVNAKRREKGRKPIDTLPSGLPGHPYYCPLAIALDGDVSPFSCYGGRTKLPPKVQEFVKEYDEGKYPDLVSEDLMRVLGRERD